MIVNDKFGRSLMEAIMDYFKEPSQYLNCGFHEKVENYSEQVGGKN
jgi:hypothetical protein